MLENHNWIWLWYQNDITQDRIKTDAILNLKKRKEKKESTPRIIWNQYQTREQSLGIKHLGLTIINTRPLRKFQRKFINQGNCKTIPGVWYSVCIGYYN